MNEIDYVAQYNDRRREGEVFERFVGDRLLLFDFKLRSYQTQQEQIEIGENRFGLEIKRDGNIDLHGNLYFELEERRHPSHPWVTSGILRPDKCWLYGIGDERRFFIFGKRTLQRIERHLPSVPETKRKETPTSKGFVMSLRVAAVFAERVFYQEGAAWAVAPKPLAVFSEDLDELVVEH